MGELCRFAAKEAAFKAHPHLHLGFHDVVILPSSDANQLTGEAALTGLTSSAPVALIRGDGEGARDQMAKVSISHDGEYATAMCIGFEASGGGHDQGPRRGWFPNFKIWS
jgi:phosphopantetheinyl transferase (holo-ACP synthase)